MKTGRPTNEPHWRLLLGSKPIPENFCYGTPEALSYLKEALGIGSARDDVHCGSATYESSEFIAGMHMGRAVGGLRGQGISTRNGGAPVILQLRGCGFDGGPDNLGGDASAHQGGVQVSRYDTRKFHHDRMFSVDIAGRTGSCEVRG